MTAVKNWPCMCSFDWVRFISSTHMPPTVPFRFLIHSLGVLVLLLKTKVPSPCTVLLASRRLRPRPDGIGLFPGLNDLNLPPLFLSSSFSHLFLFSSPLPPLFLSSLLLRSLYLSSLQSSFFGRPFSASTPPPNRSSLGLSSIASVPRLSSRA